MRMIIGIALLLFSAASWGQFLDGHKLMALCDSARGTFDEGRCVGYVVGISDSIVASTNRREMNRRICLPRTTSQAELKKMVVAYIELVPQLRGYVATFLVEMALRNKYPCGS